MQHAAKLIVALAFVALGCGGGSSAPAVAIQLQGLTLQTPGAQFPVDSAVQLKAWAHYSDGSRVDVTSSTQWSSSTPGIAAISPSGIVSFHNAGATRLQGLFEGRMVAATLYAEAATLSRLEVNSTMQGDLAKGDGRTFKAFAVYANGARVEVTDRATWSTDAQTLALGDRPGLVIGHAQGTGVVRAAWRSVEAGAYQVVGAARIVGMRVVVPSAVVRPGDAQQLHAIVTSSDGTERYVTHDALWTSSNQERLQIGAQPGLITAGAAGHALVTATWQGLSATSGITVNARLLTHLAFTTPALQLANGLTLQTSLMGTFDDGAVVDLTSSAAWTSSNELVATIAQNGDEAGTLLTHAEGGSVITATVSGQTARLQLAVTSPVLVSLHPTLPAGRLSPGQEANLKIIGRFSDGVLLNLTGEVEVHHGAQLFTTLDGDRLTVRGAALGDAPMEVEFGEFRAAVPLEVSAEHVVAFWVGQPVDFSQNGPAQDTTRFQAWARYSDGREFDVTEYSSWWLSDANVAVLSDEPGSRGWVSVQEGGTADLQANLSPANVTRSVSFSAPQ